MVIDDKDTAVNISPQYLAGVFDSDGSFTLAKHRRPDFSRGYSYYVSLQITWKETEKTIKVLEAIKSSYGGNIHSATSKAGFAKGLKYIKYQIAMKQSLVLLEQIIPYLNIKKRQAQICFDFATKSNAGVFNAHRIRTDEEWSELDGIYLTMRALNGKNGKGKSSRFGSVRPKQIFLLIDGQSKSIEDWSSISGTPYYRILQRHNQKWSDWDAVYAPVYFRNRKQDKEKGGDECRLQEPNPAKLL